MTRSIPAALLGALLAICGSPALGVEPVGPDHQINTTNLDNSMQPASAGFDKGGYVVVWAAPDGGIYAQIYNSNGNQRVGEFRAAKGSDLTNPKVATLSNGWFVVTWQSFRSSNNRYTVHGQVFTGTGNRKGVRFTARAKKKWDSRNQSVAAIGKTFILTWSAANDSLGKGIYGQRYNVRGRTLGKPFLIAPKGSNATIARIESDQYFVAWEDIGDTIKGRRLGKNGNTIRKPIKISPSTDLDRRNPSVAGLPNLRRFVVFWRTETNGAFVYTLDARVYNRRNRLLKSFVVATSYNQSTSRIAPAATLEDGRAVVAWGDDIGFFNEISFQVLTGAGNPKGEIVQANSTYDGKSPTVAPASSHGLIVAWQDTGSFTGNIYGRLFDGD